MPAKTRTVTVTEEVFELTRDELLSLKTAMWGGNALSGTAELMEIAAAIAVNEPIPRGRGTHIDIAKALRERAKLLDGGIKKINDIIWPDAVWPEKPQTFTEERTTMRNKVISDLIDLLLNTFDVMIKDERDGSIVVLNGEQLAFVKHAVAEQREREIAPKGDKLDALEDAVLAYEQQPSDLSLATGCRSAASPCTHQRTSPSTLCDVCRSDPLFGDQKDAAT